MRREIDLLLLFAFFFVDRRPQIADRRRTLTQWGLRRPGFEPPTAGSTTSRLTSCPRAGILDATSTLSDQIGAAAAHAHLEHTWSTCAP